MDYGLDGILGLGYMEDFTYNMTLASDLTGSQWIRWNCGFLCLWSLWSHCCSDGYLGWCHEGKGDMICVV